MSYDIYDLNNILNEMRTYNPKADEHGGKYIIPGWADRIDKALSNQEPVGEVVLGEYDDCGDHPDAKVVCIAAQGQADWNNFRDGTKLFMQPMPLISEHASLISEVAPLVSEQEPAAWIIEDEENKIPRHFSSVKDYVMAYPDRKVTPLYAHPAPSIPAVPEKEGPLKDYFIWHQMRDAMFRGDKS